MAVSPDYIEFVLEQLAPAAAATRKRMFGGVGLYADGLFFGLIAEDTLYFKVDETNRADFEAHGCEAFRPYKDTRSMNYFAVPEEVLEDSDQLSDWARRAIAVAARSKR
jgi:DNA transformation protein and related proteins